MDPLGPPPDARYTGAFARQPLGGSGLAYGALGSSARGTGQPARFGMSNAFTALLLALSGRRRAASAPPVTVAKGPASPMAADFSAPLSLGSAPLTASRPVRAKCGPGG